MLHDTPGGQRPLIQRSPRQPAGTKFDGHTALLRRAVRAAHRAEADLSMSYGYDVKVNEAALLFGDEDTLYQFAEDIHRDHAWHIFNTVEDSGPIVSTQAGDDRTAYHAKYVFVSDYRRPDFRLELMLIREGYSSVHSPMLSDSSDRPHLVHVSWKAPSLEAYGSQLRRLRDAGIKEVAALSSDYGHFSYWGMLWPYLKPRVNLRDVG